MVFKKDVLPLSIGKLVEFVAVDFDCLLGDFIEFLLDPSEGLEAVVVLH